MIIETTLAILLVVMQSLGQSADQIEIIGYNSGVANY